MAPGDPGTLPGTGRQPGRQRSSRVSSAGQARPRDARNGESANLARTSILASYTPPRRYRSAISTGGDAERGEPSPDVSAVRALVDRGRRRAAIEDVRIPGVEEEAPHGHAPIREAEDPLSRSVRGVGRCGANQPACLRWASTMPPGRRLPNCMTRCRRFVVDLDIYVLVY